MPPKVSICLPVFNGERYLADAINSVLNQSLVDWELVVCDDGSSDKSVEIAGGFAEREPRVKLHENAVRLGLFSNYNRCMELATGDLIKLFAQDDLLSSNALEKLVNVFEIDSNIALTACAKHWVDDSGAVLETIRQFDSETKLVRDDVIFQNLMQFTNWVGEPSCVMFPRRWIGGGFDTALYHSGDIEFWFRILEHGTLCYLPEILCSFRRHEKSESSYNLRSLSFALDFMRMGEKYGELLAGKGITRERYLKDLVQSAARVVFSLVDDEDVQCADTSRVAELEPASSKENLAYMTKMCFEALYQLVYQAEKSNALKYDLTSELYEAEEKLASAMGSLSWRVTKPIRDAKRRLQS